MLKTLAACIAVSIVSNAALPAIAAPLRLARDLTFPAIHHASASRAHAHAAYATQSDVGSAGDVTADAPVRRPSEAPCVDTLFKNVQFAAYAGQPFVYTPPVGCPGPYAKIVFNGDFSVSAGVQFDRTASIQLGNVPIYFGTTAEPSSTYAPSWHVERDVTDDAEQLALHVPGEADIFNIVNSTYTGVISGTAYLQFYPATKAIPAAKTPNVVMAIPGVAGGPQHLNTGTDTLERTVTLPKNTERVYLDVYAQGQQNDEFFYTCAPNNVAAELFDCGNGPLRETEISIDGIPAGAAPVTPWIFTGGIDPFLWTPIPGAETLEFKPARVDLTPFAAVLADGKPHAIAISVDNADSYFQGYATLFAYVDFDTKAVTGAVTRNTLVANPAASVAENLSGTSPSVDGTISVASSRAYNIVGYVNTSKGRVTTSVASKLNFANEQSYANESDYTGTGTYRQATVNETLVTTVGNNGAPEYALSYAAFPLALSIATLLDQTVTGTQTTTVDQHFIHAAATLDSSGLYVGYESNEVTPTDTLDIAGGGLAGNSAMSSMQRFEAIDTLGTCYTQTVRAAANLVTSVSNAPCDTTFARSVMHEFGLGRR